MNVLIIGSGGREHALAWKIRQSPLLGKLFIAPGNAGTGMEGENVPLKVKDFSAIRSFVLEHNIGMVVIGPEAPLVDGLHDEFLADPELCDVDVIGPVRQAAMLEGSKVFAKKFLERHRIPTARYQTFTRDNFGEAGPFLQSLKPPYVLKADGLAAGKGVLICHNLQEATRELHSMLLNDKFGRAGHRVIIEEFLQGIELSVFVLCDGLHYIILPEAKDYKRVGEGDTGLNTGGMGAISPVPFANEDFRRKVEDRIIRPTIQGLVNDRINYQGFLFFGLMNSGGDPYVIEYNARMGDPEAESVIPRIRTDLLELFLHVADGSLDKVKLETDPRTVVSVMLVSGGYPGDFTKGVVISGLENVKEGLVYHAGTARAADGSGIVTSGGRVMTVTSYGSGLEDALGKAYRNAELINYEGKYYRRDIGSDLLMYSND